MTERVAVKPKILSLNDSNDIYMKMNIVILSEDVNFNNAQFDNSFIQGVLDSKENFIGIPFLVNRNKLENGDYDELSHELDLNSGELDTDQIGSFVDFWEEEVDGANCLLGSIRIFKRFPKVCSAIVKLVEDGSLETSCEVVVNEYKEISEDGIRTIHYNDGKNYLIGSAIVTSGAEKRSKPTLLVAEAYQKDISSQQGGDKVTKTKDKMEIFNKGVNIAVHGKLEFAELKINDLFQKIYNIVNPIDTENGGRNYNYIIRDLYTGSVVFEDWDDYQVLFKAKYSVDGETVTLADKDDWVKGSYGFIPENVSVNELMEQNSEKITSLKKELNELKEEKETMSKKQDLTVEELNEKIEGLEKEVSELKDTNKELEETIVSQKEVAVKATETEKELNEQVQELTKYKEQVETAEKEAKTAELNDKYSKLLSEEAFKSEKVQNAIAELNESDLNSIVVSEIAKEKVAATSTEEEVVEVFASKQGNLIEPTVLQKYGLD